MERLIRASSAYWQQVLHCTLLALPHIFADATTNLFCCNYKHFLSDDLMKQERERALIKAKVLPNFELCIGETVQPHHHTDRALENQTSFPAPSTVQLPSAHLPAH